MNYIIVDLEATCWQPRNDKQNEIIEIGAVKIHSELELRSEFSAFVKPILNPRLSPFCKELTTITQQEVDQADTFEIVIDEFIDFCTRKANTKERDEFVLCSWGHYDKKQFVADCKLHELDTDWLENHISLKHQYAEITDTNRKRCGMGSVLKREGLKLEGTHHRGIDDARNIVKIFNKYFDRWDFKKR